MTQTIQIKDIKIPKPFQARRPRQEKLDAKKADFAANGAFDPLPVLDQDMNLIDGYVAYVAAVELGHDTIQCDVRENPMTKVVSARHEGCDKDYQWALSNRHAKGDYIKVGTEIAVLTRYGRKKAVVTGIREVPAIEAKKFKTVLGRWHVENNKESQKP